MPEIQMPKLSDTMTEGTLVLWKKKKGDKVSAGDIIAEIETDKATMEWESPEDGTLTEIYVEEGGKVNVGDKIAFIGGEGEEAQAEEKKEEKKEAKKEEAHAEAKIENDCAAKGAGRGETYSVSESWRRRAYSALWHAQNHRATPRPKPRSGSALLSQHRHRCRAAHGRACRTEVRRRRRRCVENHRQRFCFESGRASRRQSSKSKGLIRRRRVRAIRRCRSWHRSRD